MTGAPVIISNVDAEGYLGIDYASMSAAERVFTLSAIGWVTSRISAIVDSDYTNNDWRLFKFYGNAFKWWPSGNLIVLPTPGSLSVLTSYDPTNPNQSPVTITIAQTTSLDIPGYINGTCYLVNTTPLLDNLLYNVRYIVISPFAKYDPNNWANGWPEDVKLVALEMLALIFTQSPINAFGVSTNAGWYQLQGSQNVTEMVNLAGAKLKFDNSGKWNDWMNRLKPFRRITI